MVQNLPRAQERGTRALLIGGSAAVLAVVVVLVVIGFAIWPHLQTVSADRSAANTGRTDQVKGSSSAAKQDAPPPNAAPSATNPETTGRARDIAKSATKNLSLTAEERKAVDDFVHQNGSSTSEQPTFTVAVGAAIPKQVQLHDLPTGLTDALAAYSGDQYLLTPSQLIVVERETRRIVAIIPTVG